MTSEARMLGIILWALWLVLAGLLIAGLVVWA